MHPESPSTFHPVPRIGLSVALVVLVLCAAVLLGVAVAAAITMSALPSEGPLLAPFRWVPVAR